MCGSTIHGKLTITGVNASPFFTANLGDPGEFLQAGPVTDCPGNTIDGSVFVSNDRFLEIEGKTADRIVAWLLKAERVEL